MVEHIVKDRKGGHRAGSAMGGRRVVHHVSLPWPRCQGLPGSRLGASWLQRSSLCPGMIHVVTAKPLSESGSVVLSALRGSVTAQADLDGPNSQFLRG